MKGGFGCSPCCSPDPPLECGDNLCCTPTTKLPCRVTVSHTSGSTWASIGSPSGAAFLADATLKASFKSKLSMSVVLNSRYISDIPDLYAYYSDGASRVNEVRARLSPIDCSASIGPVSFADPVIDGGNNGSLTLRTNWWLTDSAGVTGTWRVSRYAVVLTAFEEDEYGDFNTILPFALSDWCGSSFSASASVRCSATIELWPPGNPNNFGTQYFFQIDGGTVTYSW